MTQVLKTDGQRTAFLCVVVGSVPAQDTNVCVAQLAERMAFNHMVVGSSPIADTSRSIGATG